MVPATNLYQGKTYYYISFGGDISKLKHQNNTIPVSAYQEYRNPTTGNIIPTTDTAIAITMLFGAEEEVSGGLPSEISKYIPGTSPEPLTFPEEVPAWKPVIVPKTAPTETPEPRKTPDDDPDPERITPYIPPFQPQPSKVPIKKPAEETQPKPFVPQVPNLKSRNFTSTISTT